MRTIASYALVALLISIVGALGTATAAHAVVKEVNVVNTDREQLFFQEQDTVGGGDQLVHTVPVGFKFVLTDIVVTSALTTSTGLIRGNIFLDNQLTSGDPFNIGVWIEPPRRNVIINLSTGVEFVANEELRVSAGGNAAGERLDFFLIGYQVAE